jgi:hypothetical protein
MISARGTSWAAFEIPIDQDRLRTRKGKARLASGVPQQKAMAPLVPLDLYSPRCCAATLGRSRWNWARRGLPLPSPEYSL